MWYATDILDNQLLRSLIDSIPTAVLFLDTVLLGEFKYLRSLIKKANDKNNQLKIRELCFCKPIIERRKPESFPYFAYPEYSAQHQIAEISAERCPIYIDLSDDITEELLKSPLLCKRDILNPHSLAIKIFNNTDSLSVYIKCIIEDRLSQCVEISSDLKELKGKLSEKQSTKFIKFLVEELNKIIDSASLILNENSLSTVQLTPTTQSFVDLFKRTPHEEKFNPQQINRLILQEVYPGEIIEYKFVNPIWRLVHENSILKSYQTRFYEAIAVQFVTLYLALQVEHKSYSSSLSLPIIGLSFFFILLIIWNETISGGPVNDWFKIKGRRYAYIFVLVLRNTNFVN